MASSGWSAASVSSAGGPSRRCRAADQLGRPPRAARRRPGRGWRRARVSTSAAGSSVSRVCHSRASHSRRPSRGSRPGSPALEPGRAARRRTRPSAASAARRGRLDRARHARLPAPAARAPRRGSARPRRRTGRPRSRRGCAGMSRSTARAVASASGIAGEPGGEAGQPLLGRRERPGQQPVQQRAGLCASGFHSCSRTSVSSNRARSTTAEQRSAWSTCPRPGRARRGPPGTARRTASRSMSTSRGHGARGTVVGQPVVEPVVARRQAGLARRSECRLAPGSGRRRSPLGERVTNSATMPGAKPVLGVDRRGPVWTGCDRLWTGCGPDVDRR